MGGKTKSCHARQSGHVQASTGTWVGNGSPDPQTQFCGRSKKEQLRTAFFRSRRGRTLRHHASDDFDGAQLCPCSLFNVNIATRNARDRRCGTARSAVPMPATTLTVPCAAPMPVTPTHGSRRDKEGVYDGVPLVFGSAKLEENRMNLVSDGTDPLQKRIFDPRQCTVLRPISFSWLPCVLSSQVLVVGLSLLCCCAPPWGVD